MNGHQKQRERSAKMIEEALFELMREKTYAGITERVSKSILGIVNVPCV